MKILWVMEDVRVCVETGCDYVPPHKVFVFREPVGILATEPRAYDALVVCVHRPSVTDDEVLSYVWEFYRREEEKVAPTKLPGLATWPIQVPHDLPRILDATFGPTSPVIEQILGGHVWEFTIEYPP